MSATHAQGQGGGRRRRDQDEDDEKRRRQQKQEDSPKDDPQGKGRSPKKSPKKGKKDPPQKSPQPSKDKSSSASPRGAGADCPEEASAQASDKTGDRSPRKRKEDSPKSSGPEQTGHSAQSESQKSKATPPCKSPRQSKGESSKVSRDDPSQGSKSSSKKTGVAGYKVLFLPRAPSSPPTRSGFGSGPDDSESHGSEATVPHLQVEERRKQILENLSSDLEHRACRMRWRRLRVIPADQDHNLKEIIDRLPFYPASDGGAVLPPFSRGPFLSFSQSSPPTLADLQILARVFGQGGGQPEASWGEEQGAVGGADSGTHAAKRRQRSLSSPTPCVFLYTPGFPEEDEEQEEQEEEVLEASGGVLPGPGSSVPGQVLPADHHVLPGTAMKQANAGAEAAEADVESSTSKPESSGGGGQDTEETSLSLSSTSSDDTFRNISSLPSSEECTVPPLPARPAAEPAPELSFPAKPPLPPNARAKSRAPRHRRRFRRWSEGSIRVLETRFPPHPPPPPPPPPPGQGAVPM